MFLFKDILLLIANFSLLNNNMQAELINTKSNCSRYIDKYTWVVR